ncbi:MAG TPA: SMC family ATPase [Nocardioides sp.]|nr:SMC family ATPase [Nocardioides sp.]
MRLHHLSVTAFGPFVDTAEVDFDALSDAGLFLLSGATGSGKSSVLDAVCFALYGAVPGDRQDAGRLRSDQAPAGLVPQATLDVSLSGRRFRIVRSPAWDRPKKRGDGMTREQARVAVSERAGDEWIHLTSRLDEAGDLLSGLLGMNLDQFCQVALLPQGHFQAFLRAKPDERQRLLAKLFRTGRFERVEAWLRDHRLALRRTSDAHATTVGDLVSRLSEAAGRPAPDELSGLATTAEGTLAPWARCVRDEAEARCRAAATEVVAATAADVQARAGAVAARELAAARSRVVAAAETIEQLERRQAAHAADVARLERARLADGVRPLARLADERAELLAHAESRAAASSAAAAPGGFDADDLAAEIRRLTDQAASLTSLLPAERRLAELREQAAADAGRLRSLAADAELAAAEEESLTSVVHELENAAVAADAAVRDLPAAEAVAAGLRRALDAHASLAAVVADRDAVHVEHAAARAQVVDLREELLDLRERRIAGMAAELAGSLAVGDDCPVCGSTDHPHPARPAALHPDGAAERRAQRAVDDAQAVELALHLRVRELDAAFTAARAETADSDPQHAALELDAAELELAGLRAAASARDATHARLAEARARTAALADERVRRQVRTTELTTGLAHVRHQAAELETSVAAARGEHPELGAVVAELETRREALRSVQADLAAADAARRSSAEAETALVHAALEAGFASPADARAAELRPDAVAELDARVLDHRTAMRSAREVLDEPEAWSLLTTPPPDVDALDAAARAAAEALERCRAADEVARQTDARVQGLAEQLAAALAAWSPVRRDLAVATTVSAFAEGKAPDNRWQMRLSAYVLAFRLSQVVAAANARLAGMSDQRYSLEHVGRRGARELRGGLSLVVRDDWSGESRDPATLSGGETFVVSLALALGLADVVTHEAGGADLQTLFVDEGFGSLDAETLDDVLDILDSLRENGRAVGVVSHVAEMRDRIPTQLVVGKSRSGSTLRVAG